MRRRRHDPPAAGSCGGARGGACGGRGVGAGAEWHVHPGTGTPIQDVIDGAGAGDTIYVHAGEYVENLDVDKRLTLIGDGADMVAVRAAARDHVFEVIASWVNISGFAIKGATRNAGIYLNGADHCNICENNCSNNNDGIYLYSSSNNTLNENNCSNNTYGAILYSSSNYNTLTENDCSYNQCGIFLGYYSSHNTLIENNCSDNYWYGIYMSS